eukprot:scaffold5939_cov111-Cylindrotheca_fusiformis.AAC.3
MVTIEKDGNEKWNSFKASERLSQALPAVASRKTKQTMHTSPLNSFDMEKDKISLATVPMSRRSKSLTSLRQLQQQDLLLSSGPMDTGNSPFQSSGPMDTGNTPFQTNVVTPSNLPPSLPSRKRSGTGLVRPGENVVSKSTEEVNHEVEEKEDFYLELNDFESSRKERRKTKRVRRPDGLVRRFSDSELSEASTINSCGENPKMKERKQKLRERREARKAQKRDKKRLEEDDDLVDTDKDEAGLTGATKQKCRSKSLDAKPSANLRLADPPRIGKPSTRSATGVRGLNRAGSARRIVPKTSNAEPDSSSTARKLSRTPSRSKKGSRTRSQSNRRWASSDSDTSDESKSSATNKVNRPTRRKRKSSKRQPRRRKSSDDGDAFGSLARRKGSRKPPSSNASEESLHVPKNLEIDVTQTDIVSPCTVTSRSVRDTLSNHSSSLQNVGSVRSKSNSSSRVSAMTFTTGCSSVSYGAFDDDFSKISEESGRTYNSRDKKTPLNVRRLTTLQEVSMKTITSSEETPGQSVPVERMPARRSIEGESSESSRFMPSKPRRIPSGILEAAMLGSNYPTPPPSPTRSEKETALGESPKGPRSRRGVKKERSTSDLQSGPTRPTHLFRKAVSERFLPSSNYPTPPLSPPSSENGTAAEDSPKGPRRRRGVKKEKSISDLQSGGKRPTHLLRKAVSERFLSSSSKNPTPPPSPPIVSEHGAVPPQEKEPQKGPRDRRGVTKEKSASDLQSRSKRPTHLFRKAVSERFLSSSSKDPSPPPSPPPPLSGNERGKSSSPKAFLRGRHGSSSSPKARHGLTKEKSASELQSASNKRPTHLFRKAVSERFLSSFKSSGSTSTTSSSVGKVLKRVRQKSPASAGAR